MKKIKFTVSGFLITLFILFLLAATIVREKGIISFQENRKLAEFPKISFSSLVDGSFFNNLSDYVGDHFAFRSKWLILNAQIDVYSGEEIINDVYIADDMLLDLSAKNENDMLGCAETINSFSQMYDSSVYVIAVPSSDGIYSSLLPAYMSRNMQKNQIDNFYSALDSDIRKIDAYNILKMLNDNYIFYRTDSKWTTYGAYCVYRTAIQKLGFSPIAYDKYTIEHVTSDFRGNLYNRSQYLQIKPDILDIYYYGEGSKIVNIETFDNKGNTDKISLYDKSYIGTNNMYKLYFDNENKPLKIITDVNNEKKILVIKDEYANCFIPFLTQHYSEITVLSESCELTDYKDIVNIEDYSQILFLVGIDNISDGKCLNSILK